MKIYKLLDPEKIFCLAKAKDPTELFLQMVPSALSLNGKGKITQKQIIQQLIERGKTALPPGWEKASPSPISGSTA
jgi:hypothetical protein